MPDLMTIIALISLAIFGAITYYIADPAWLRKESMQNGFVALGILMLVFPGVVVEMIVETVNGSDK